jgi:hypothetical protein
LSKAATAASDRRSTAGQNVPFYDTVTGRSSLQKFFNLSDHDARIGSGEAYL